MDNKHSSLFRDFIERAEMKLEAEGASSRQPKNETPCEAAKIQKQALSAKPRPFLISRTTPRLQAIVPGGDRCPGAAGANRCAAMKGNDFPLMCLRCALD